MSTPVQLVPPPIAAEPPAPKHPIAFVFHFAFKVRWKHGFSRPAPALLLTVTAAPAGMCCTCTLKLLLCCLAGSSNGVLHPL
jgi:hypothetical protein